MNRFIPRAPGSPRARIVTSGLAACALGAAVALTGCGSGQISQVATQEAGVNGSSAAVGDITLRNIHLKAAQTSDYVEPGARVELMFTASNESAESDDRLVSVTSEIGSVSLSGDTTLPAGGVLVVGTPDGQPTALRSVEAADTAQADVTLSKPISNGLTYDFTFDFEQAGETTVAVPISAGDAPRRDETAQTGNTQHGGHH